MKQILRLYGEKGGLEDRIREIVPGADFSILSRALDTVVLFNDLDEGEFLDVCDALDDRIYSDRDVSLEETVVTFLASNGLKLATAESCTGGLVAASIVSVPGASEVFYEGLVTYSNEAKMERLSVQPDTLEEFGAVSEQTAIEMARGLLSENVDVAVSTTGIAGPGGSTWDKPVGLVYIGLAYRGEKPIAKRYIFPGGREQVRQSAKNTALFTVLQYLKENL
ncbi:MAG: nicotinamide-nucleotide amidohydrolase family protein [Clostridia bacterium]|nr:nicotinamide-nucleotide amidohydrolase family protein [Clostridia bacterium]